MKTIINFIYAENWYNKMLSLTREKEREIIGELEKENYPDRLILPFENYVMGGDTLYIVFNGKETNIQRNIEYIHYKIY